MMPLFTKLNLKDCQEVLILDAPVSFENELQALVNVTIRRKIEAGSQINFALAFVQTLAQVEACTTDLLPLLADEAVLWFAYPKGTSKNYRCEFNRDTGWTSLGAAGYEGVRIIAIDADWSALRFRRVEAIRKFTRDPKHALSLQGKARSTSRKKDRS